ncbi:MAG: molybdopterin-dependent oxidoreductase [Deltaproteobacteria bacterium]|nr:molybdopterin-dependent oxidoreductase [Deltaproteobacteria bacterium]
MEKLRNVDPSVSRAPLPLDAENLPTVCVLCSHNCGLRVDVKDGRITAIRGDESSPITAGYVCNKAFSIQHYVEHDQRVKHPLRRTADGRFERIGWDTAIAEISEKLTAIRAAHGARAIGLVGIGGQANHMDAPFGIGFLRGLGSKRWFNAFAQEKTQHSLVDQWLFNASPAVMLHADMEQANFMLVLGTNPRISNRGHNANETFQAFAKDPQRRLVVADPRDTETTRLAHVHLRVRPGTDAYLLLGMAATIVSGELADAKFLHEKTTDFEALRQVLAEVDIAEMARRCGIDLKALTDTAAELARAERAAIFYDLGVEQTPFSTLISYLIRVLLTLTGNIGRRGGNVFFETFSPPVLEAERVREPERALASGIPAIRALGNMGMFSPTLCPEEIMIDHPERLRAVIVEGSNPLLSYSDTARWREACDKLDLLVVIDPAMTETAALAHYVLPTPVGYEKWEIANFPKGFPEILVQLRPPVVPGPEEALPEPEIYARLAEAMGLFGAPPAELFDLAPQALQADGAAAFLATAQQRAMEGGKVKDPTNALLFWAYRTVGAQLPAPSLAAVWLLSGLNGMMRTDSVLRTLGDEWRDKSPFEIGAEVFRRILAHPEGVEIARGSADNNLEANINYADKRVHLAPPPMLDEMRRALKTAPAHDPAYPFILGAGLRTRWTANTIHRDPAWRKGQGPHCALHLTPADAQRLGVRNGDSVRVRTRRGALTLPAQIDPKLLDGYVWMPNGFGHVHDTADGQPAAVGGNHNELTDIADRDPFTGVPHHRYVQCQIEPA